MDIVTLTLKINKYYQFVSMVNAILFNPTIFFITEKGILGQLKNKGLMKCTQKYVFFLDDDVIITKEFVDKSLEILENSSYIGVCCSFTTCMIVKRKEFLKIGGFPSYDSHINLREDIFTFKEKLGIIHNETDKKMFRNTLKYLFYAFDSKFPFGHNNGIITSFQMIFYYLKTKRPFLSLSYIFWFIKAIDIKMFDVLYV